jgi:hypothetical protein
MLSWSVRRCCARATPSPVTLRQRACHFLREARQLKLCLRQYGCESLRHLRPKLARIASMLPKTLLSFYESCTIKIEHGARRRLLLKPHSPVPTGRAETFSFVTRLLSLTTMPLQNREKCRPCFSGNHNHGPSACRSRCRRLAYFPASALNSKHLPRGRESPWEEAPPVERLGPQEHR